MSAAPHGCEPAYGYRPCGTVAARAPSRCLGAFGFDAVRMMVGELVDGGAVAVDLLGGFVPGGSDDQSGDDEYGARVGVPGGVCVMSGHVVSPTRPAG